MYKIKVKNIETGKIWWEYGFSKHIMKRIHFFYQKTNDDFFLIYEVLDICKIYFSWKTFKKCLTKTCVVV